MSSVSREMRCCFSGSRYSSVRMLCRRSASLTRTTRTSFTLARFGRHHFEAADFGYALDEMGDVGSEALFDAGDGILGVFDGVMENRGGQRGGVEPHVREDVRDFEEVGEIGIAGAAELVMVPLGGDFVSAAEHPGIFGRAVLAELFEQFLETSVELASGAVAVEGQGDFVRRRHGLVYARKGASGERGISGDNDDRRGGKCAAPHSVFFHKCSF